MNKLITANTLKYLLFILPVISCKTQDNLSSLQQVNGAILTCITDSTAFFNATVVKLSLKKTENNSECNNRPKFSYNYNLWPSDISLWFDAKRFYLSTNKLYSKNSQDQVETIRIPLRYGKMKYNPKTKKMKLSCAQFKWTQEYAVEYSQKDSLIILTTIQ